MLTVRISYAYSTFILCLLCIYLMLLVRISFAYSTYILCLYYVYLMLTVRISYANKSIYNEAFQATLHLMTPVRLSTLGPT